MSLERSALAVQLAAFEGIRPPNWLLRAARGGLGGVCLFAGNVGGGRESLRSRMETLRAANPQFVVAVDEEGGDVTRLHVREGSPVLGPGVLGHLDDLELTRSTGSEVGAELAALGVTLNLAPVGDLNTSVDNPVIGVRSFGTDPALVSAHVAAWIEGIQSAGVAACVKHFPGHGDTRMDSHFALPRITADAHSLLRRELLPFESAVSAGVAAVMTGHLLTPSIDPDLPASLSPAAHRILRGALGFSGVVVTDALDMRGATAALGAGADIGDAAVHAIAAGADLLCLGAVSSESHISRVQAALVDAVHEGRLAESRLADAAAKVSQLTSAADARHPTQARDQWAAARRALTVEGSLPRLDRAIRMRLIGEPNMAAGSNNWGLGELGALSHRTPLAQLPIDVPVILEVRDGHRQPGLADLLSRLADHTVVVIDWGWPAPLAGPANARVLTRGSSAPMKQVVLELLVGHGWQQR